MAVAADRSEKIINIFVYGGGAVVVVVWLTSPARRSVVVTNGCALSHVPQDDHIQTDESKN